MNEDQIKQFVQVIGAWCWHHDFAQFCQVTGFKGDYAQSKWLALQNLRSALGGFDPATLAKILNS